MVIREAARMRSLWQPRRITRMSGRISEGGERLLIGGPGAEPLQGDGDVGLPHRGSECAGVASGRLPPLPTTHLLSPLRVTASEKDLNYSALRVARF